MTTFGFALDLYYFAGSVFFLIAIFILIMFIVKGGLKAFGR